MDNKNFAAELRKQISNRNRDELFAELVSDSTFEFKTDTVPPWHHLTAICNTPYGIFSVLIPTSLNFGDEDVKEQREDLKRKAIKELLDGKYEVPMP